MKNNKIISLIIILIIYIVATIIGYFTYINLERIKIQYL